MKNKMKKLLVALVVTVVALSSCKDATTAQYKALGCKHIVTLYGASGTPIKQWTSTGSVSNEGHSDGWYFEDEVTGKLVEVAGTLTIEVK